MHVMGSGLEIFAISDRTWSLHLYPHFIKAAPLSFNGMVMIFDDHHDDDRLRHFLLCP